MWGREALCEEIFGIQMETEKVQWEGSGGVSIVLSRQHLTCFLTCSPAHLLTCPYIPHPQVTEYDPGLPGNRPGVPSSYLEVFPDHLLPLTISITTAGAPNTLLNQEGLKSAGEDSTGLVCQSWWHLV